MAVFRSISIGSTIAFRVIGQAAISGRRGERAIRAVDNLAWRVRGLRRWACWQVFDHRWILLGSRASRYREVSSSMLPFKVFLAKKLSDLCERRLVLRRYFGFH
jgi:hypothetical protein